VCLGSSLFSTSDVHGVFHNVAYWIQGNVLSVEQRFTLYDAGYALMPELTYVDYRRPRLVSGASTDLRRLFPISLAARRRRRRTSWSSPACSRRLCC
jgi:hypothetical protein